MADRHTDRLTEQKGKTSRKMTAQAKTGGYTHRHMSRHDGRQTDGGGGGT
jgi:hypothetical protein